MFWVDKDTFSHKAKEKSFLNSKEHSFSPKSLLLFFFSFNKTLHLSIEKTALYSQDTAFFKLCIWMFMHAW